jgi:hypothetical protein
MTTIRISNNGLKRMLNISKRKQTVNGKQQSQVESCVLLCDGSKARITSLTRDLTGLTEVVADVEGTGNFPIPDIDRVLGVLSLHGENLTLSWDGEKNKLRFKSAGKQTTLDSSFEAKAFTHSQETIDDFHARSETLANKIDPKSGTYTLSDGTKQQSFCSFEVNVADLYDACRCDTINGQRLNRYSFTIPDAGPYEEHGDCFRITVGDPSLGQTTSEIVMEKKNLMPIDGFSWDFDGGLDELFKGFTGKATLHFFDFRELGQGIRFAVSFGNDEFAFQSGTLG